MELTKKRVDWMDYAKGICIILVVAMHSTLGVEKATGEISALHSFIDWARPFRMPDFFLISGLFLASRIDRPWRSYLDSKVIHFGYFYVLWMSIQFLLKGHDIYVQDGTSGLFTAYLNGFVEPFGTLWFIYMLAVFFFITKALRAAPPIFIFVGAALLEAYATTGTIATGHTLIDEFAARYVYFFTGYWLARHVFNLAADVDRRSALQIFAGLLVWGVANFIMVQSGLSLQPGISLVMGFVGAGAVIASGVLLSKFKFAAALRYCGENSIVIYLAFFFFMAGTRTLLLRFAPELGLSLMAATTTAAGVIGPLVLFWATRHTKLSFLFRRPAWAKWPMALAKPNAEWHSASYVGKPAQATQPQAR